MKSPLDKEGATMEGRTVCADYIIFVPVLLLVFINLAPLHNKRNMILRIF